MVRLVCSRSIRKFSVISLLGGLKKSSSSHSRLQSQQRLHLAVQWCSQTRRGKPQIGNCGKRDAQVWSAEWIRVTTYTTKGHWFESLIVSLGWWHSSTGKPQSNHLKIAVGGPTEADVETVGKVAVFKPEFQKSRSRGWKRFATN